MKELKQSQTIVIKRSQIKFNPLNPKRHSADNVKRQKKNLKKVGFLGGVVWNETTGHVIDGHRRLQAMDDYYGYNGDADSDYDVKVEATQLNEKEELEQTTYMAAGNSGYELDLIANYIDRIDYSDIGFSDSELSDILNFSCVDVNDIQVESLDDALFAAPRGKSLYDDEEYNIMATGATTFQAVPHPSQNESPSEFDISNDSDVFDEQSTLADDKQRKIEAIKAVKARVNEYSADRNNDEEAYITLSFSSMSAKEDFCEMVGVTTDVRYIKGELVASMIS